LTDLTFIEDGIPSVLKKSNMINFAKRAKTAEVIRDIQQYQNVAYSLHSVPELQDYILSNMQAAGDVHEMYDKSLQIEPREREDEKIVRYVYPPKARQAAWAWRPSSRICLNTVTSPNQSSTLTYLRFRNAGFSPNPASYEPHPLFLYSADTRVLESLTPPTNALVPAAFSFPLNPTATSLWLSGTSSDDNVCKRPI
jgi:son of sevenless-like protein